MTRKIASLLFLVALATLGPTLHATIPESERVALIAIYEKTGGANWTNKTNWLGAHGTECTWYGVSCNTGQSTVLTLVIQGNNLVGPIPTELAQLPNLAGLALGANKLSGPIPAQISTLTQLQYLLLHENPLTGGIPASLSKLVNVDALYLYRTSLGGSIPTSLGSMTKLKLLLLHESGLTGDIPTTLGNLTALEDLWLQSNKLTGQVPASLGNLPRLKNLYLDRNDLRGGIPSTFGNLSSLVDFRIYDNPNLGGTIPPQLGSLKLLQILIAYKCGLIGSIPPELGGLAALRDLRISFNSLTGAIPAELGNLRNLELAYIGNNGFKGALPSQLGNLTKMVDFQLWDTDVSGPLPAFFSNMQSLKYLVLFGNRFSGPIPSTFGSLTGLQGLWIQNNALTGEIPASLGNLVNLSNDLGLDLRYGGLVSSNPNLVAFLESKQNGTATFTSLQTVAPTGVSAKAVSQTSIRVDWTPIAFQAGAGGYQVEVATSSNGPFRGAITTAGKAASSALVTGLSPSTSYVFRLSTVTYGGGVQKNTIVSATTPVVSATTFQSQPNVVLAHGTSPMIVFADGSSTTTTGYVLANVGQAPTTITLTQNGSFFTQSPASFTLAAGASKRVTISSLPQGTAGAFRGSSTPAGAGVPSNAFVPVAMLAAAAPTSGTPNVVVTSTRVDVSGPSNTNPSGSVKFRNIGTAPAVGLLASDVAWIVPAPEVITINPGAEVTASFTVNRTRRPDASALSGTLTANLSFVYLTRSGTPSRSTLSGAPTLSTPVTVGDTVQPPVTASGIPALLPNEVGLVVPGVAKQTEGGGLVVSDLSIGNALSGLPASDLKVFYLSGGTALSASQSVSSGQSLSLADVVGTVFQHVEETGVLHVRSTLVEQLGVNASVANKSNATGSFGTAIPVFRTNRAIAKGETSLITGLRQSEDIDTALYLQEAVGTATTADINFVSALGQSVGSLTNQAVGAFATTVIAQSSVPAGSVSAVIANKGDGAIVAYAKPVDRSSGDSWAVADWNRYFGRAGTEEQVIPVAGSKPGRNATYFRTDISIANPGSVAASGTLRYYQQSPTITTIDKPISIEASRTLEINDAVGTYFGATTPSTGHVVLIPAGASLTMSSRTYTTVNGTTKTFGTGVPTMTRSSAMRLGQAKVFGGIDDSKLATTYAAQPGTFRTNVGLVETEGLGITVKVSVFFYDGTQLAAAGINGAKEYNLAPHEFLQLNSIVGEVLGQVVREDNFGELTNVQVKVEVTAGSGGLLAWASSTDNGSGDTVVRIE